MHNLKLSDRKQNLLENLECLEPATGPNQMKRVLNAAQKTPMNSTDLAMLETIILLYQILKDHHSLSRVAKELAEDKILSTSKLEEIAQILKSKEKRQELRLIEQIEVFSFESGLWKMCNTCSDIFSYKCIKCDS